MFLEKKTAEKSNSGGANNRKAALPGELLPPLPADLEALCSSPAAGLHLALKPTVTLAQVDLCHC